MNNKKPPSSYRFKTISPETQSSKIQKILDNAKKYEKDRETKRDYMAEGLKKLKKTNQSGFSHQISSTNEHIYQYAQPKDRKHSRQSEVSSKKSEKSVSKSKDIGKPQTKVTKNYVEPQYMKANNRPLQNDKKQTEINNPTIKITNANSPSLQKQNFEYKNKKSFSLQKNEFKSSKFAEMKEERNFIQTERKIQVQQKKGNIQKDLRKQKIQSIEKRESVTKKPQIQKEVRQQRVEKEQRKQKDIQFKGDEKGIIEKSYEKSELRELFYKCQSENNKLIQKLAHSEKEVIFLRNQNKELQVALTEFKLQIKRDKTEQESVKIELQNCKINSSRTAEELARKCHELNNDIIKKKQECNQLITTLQERDRKIRNTDNQFRFLDEKLKRKQQQIQTIREQYRKTIQRQRGSWEEHRKTLKKEVERRSEEELRKQKNKIDHLEVQLGKYEKLMMRKNQQINDLQLKIRDQEKEIKYRPYTESSFKETSNLEHQILEREKERNQLVGWYEGKLLEKDQQIKKLQESKQWKASGILKERGESIEEEGVQDMIHHHMFQMNTIRESNAKKIEEIYELKIELQKSKAQNMNLISQKNYLYAQLKSKEKKNSTKKQLQYQGLSQEVQILKNKNETLRNTLQTKKKQIIEKDHFIENRVLRMTNNENILPELKQLLSRLAKNQCQ